MADPDATERASALEPRFAELCRSSRWRPSLVRCFALARDPAEHRVCARRLERGQRDDVRRVQRALYGDGADGERPPTVRTVDACRRLVPVRDHVLACDKLPAPIQVRMAVELETLARNAAAHARTPGASEALAWECEMLADQVRSLLVQVGC